MIWLALFIPLIAIIFVSVRFTKRISILEYILLFAIPLACIAIGKYASTYSQTHDIEYWNSFGVRAMYEEEWKERWTETETYTTTDGEGNTQTHTRIVTRNKTHPEQWSLFDDIEGSYSISKSYFEQICTLWSNRTFKDMQREENTSHTITKDGNAYVAIYDDLFDHTIPVCKQHTYENRIQCSKSVFNFEEVSDETKAQYKLFDYPPEDVFGFNPILGHSNQRASSILSHHNAHNGRRRQIHMMLLVFQDQSLEAGLFQESYWKGGNKNEFILCVGLKGNEIKWTRIISWTEQEELKIRVARKIKEMEKFDAVQVVSYMGEEIPSGFLRKKFADFNYLSVEPTMTAIWITFAITFIVTLVIMIIAINNECDFEGFIEKFGKRRHNRYNSFG